MTLVDWDRATSAEREAYARAIAGEFVFRGLETHSRGGITREVAAFTRDDVEWVLVPGGRVTLGFDPEGWTPTETEAREWASFAAEFGIEQDARGWVLYETLRPRVLDLPTLLVEREAQDIGISTRHADVVAELASEGYRLPTSDEWEHLCGGGARTLFRWGDHAPHDQYPIDRGGFREHVAPNAFGLLIASNPYHYEVVAEPDRLRGGDGGSAICGGTGAFLGWLPLATAFFDPGLSAPSPDGVLTPRYTIVRRVVEVGGR